MNNNHKIILSLLVCMPLAMPALATNRVYVGLSAGGANLTDNKQAESITSAASPIITPYSPSPGQAFGADVGVYAGVAHRFASGFDLAGELNATWFFNQIKQDYTGGGTKQTYTEQVNYIAGLSILPGYFVTDNTELYLRGSIGTSHFSSSATGQVLGKGLNKPFSHDGLYYGLGLGVSTALSQHWRLGLEGDYLWFARFSGSQSDVAPPAPTNKRTVQFAPNMYEGKVTLSYSF